MLAKAKILPFGKIYVYGQKEPIEFTKELAEEIVKNFNKGYPHYKPFVNIDHESSEKYGDVKELYIEEDGLWAVLELNEEGQKMLEEHKYEYVSPEIDFAYVDRETGEEVGVVLLGVALTNRPALPETKLTFKDVFIAMFSGMRRLLGERKRWNGMLVVPERTKQWDWDDARDGNKIIEEKGWKAYAKCHLYVNTRDFEEGPSGVPEVKAAYKFPVCKLENGEFHLYFRAAVAALAYLHGARGVEVDLTDAEKLEVIRKIKEIYELFGEEFRGSDEVALCEEIERLKRMNKHLMDKLTEYENTINEFKEKERERELNAFKQELVKKGVPPALAEEYVRLFKEGKMDKESILKLAEHTKRDLVRQFVNPDSADIVDIVAKQMRWK
jgi:hypothetical protein